LIDLNCTEFYIEQTTRKKEVGKTLYARHKVKCGFYYAVYYGTQKHWQEFQLKYREFHKYRAKNEGSKVDSHLRRNWIICITVIELIFTDVMLARRLAVNNFPTEFQNNLTVRSMGDTRLQTDRRMWSPCKALDFTSWKTHRNKSFTGVVGNNRCLMLEL
jgi:hypothetical protein